MNKDKSQPNLKYAKNGSIKFECDPDLVSLFLMCQVRLRLNQIVTCYSNNKIFNLMVLLDEYREKETLILLNKSQKNYKK